MILTIHGAFDDTSDRNSGIATLTDRLREEHVTADVHEINVHDVLVPTFDQLIEEPFFGVFFSNGMDQGMKLLELAMSRLSEAEQWRTNVHLCCLDGVHFGGGFLSPRWHMAPWIRSCLNVMRTLDIGVPPWHQKIDKDSPPEFETVFVEADHGRLPSAPVVQDAVCQRARDVWAAYAAGTMLTGSPLTSTVLK